MKRTENSLTDHWDNIKEIHIYIIGSLKEKSEGKGLITFEDIRAENFPNLGKETNIISKSRKHRDTPTGLIQKGAHKDTLHFKNKILKREY